MQFLKLLIIIITLIGISSCSTSTVRTDTTTFYVNDYKSDGVIIVKPGDDMLAQTLQFSNYKKKVEQQLSKQGYKTTNTINEADYIAFLTYGLDNERDRSEKSNSEGVVAKSDGYSMPTFASTRTEYSTIYIKVIAIDIVERKSLEAGIPNKVFEMRGRNIGSHSHLNCVFNPMLKSMFNEFPGVNGKTITHDWYVPEC